MKSFNEIYSRIKDHEKKMISVAVAADEPVLEAIKGAVDNKLAGAYLVGDEKKIRDIAAKIQLSLEEDIVIIDEKDPIKAALEAVKLVSSGKAHIMMKGLINSADFLRAVLNKEFGLRTGKKLNHISVIDAKPIDKLILMTDAGMVMYPTLEDKVQMLGNCAAVCRSLEIEDPKAAVVCAVEVVNPAMQPTVDAAILSKMSDRGQIKGITVDGPLALDNAIDMESAVHKGITNSPVAGQADVLLLPSIEAGNIMWKTITFMSDGQIGGLIMGASAPVVMPSRSDNPSTKLNSIALALLACEKGGK